MYVPAPFRAEDRSQLLAFIEREPFGILVSTSNGAPFATHVPFVILERGERVVLGLHVAKANPQWQQIDGCSVLAIFRGAHAMISAGWYAEPAASVPTWDYTAVHCSGRARLTGADGTERILRRIVETFETSWRMEDAQPEYIERMQHAIIGIEITVESIAGSFKLSQNRSAEDRARVLEKLSASPRASDRAVAADMSALTE